MNRLLAVVALVLLGALPCSAAGPFLALTGATVYASPEAAPLANATLIIEDGRIAAVGSGLAVPAGAKVLDCTGLFITAGFQNSHVHFTEPKWNEAAGQRPEALAAALRAMLTRYGFTTVVDTGSLLANTVALRRRIEAGDLPGPRILTAGGAIYPENGLPFYVKEAVPAEFHKYLDQPETPADSAAAARRTLGAGADVVKLFTGSLVSLGSVKPMRVDIARAAVDEAHGRKALVYTHPSNDAGLQVAIDAGVDILAHTAPGGGSWDAALVAKMRDSGIALAPTLKLWSYEVLRFGGTPERAESITQNGVRQLQAFSSAGGQVLFGTDVGYMRDYDTADEFARMAQAGMTPMQILASLTTAPAARFKEGERRGRVAQGMDADLVVLEADPAADVRNFSRVRHTLRGGRLIYSRD